jgi:squalene-hopene/tetraprenyl-beta-curcumene cyclase
MLGTSVSRLRAAVPAFSLAAACCAALAAGALQSDGSKKAPPPAAETAPPRPVPADLKKAASEAIDRGLKYLRSKQDVATGTWMMEGRPEAGITALALTAFLKSPRGYTAADGPFIAKPVDWLASLAKEDGSIFDTHLSNYVTAAAVLALRESGDPRFKPLLEKAQGFLLTTQSDESEGYAPDNKFYGGAGYGSDERPDLSNMSFWIEALDATGLPKEDAAYKKALVFLNRCQNHSESHSGEYKDVKTGEVFVPGNDGGATYMPGYSFAGAITLPDGRKVARSYGSMTYALLKCYLLAGLPKDDPRVKAAVDWIGKNFTVTENPGFDLSKDPEANLQGLFYYYLTMAKALDQYGERKIVDGSGRDREWAAELAAQILSLQKPDGSWIGLKSRWWENVPELATSYNVLALEHCLSHL